MKDKNTITINKEAIQKWLAWQISIAKDDIEKVEDKYDKTGYVNYGDQQCIYQSKQSIVICEHLLEILDGCFSDVTKNFEEISYVYELTSGAETFQDDSIND